MAQSVEFSNDCNRQDKNGPIRGGELTLSGSSLSLKDSSDSNYMHEVDVAVLSSYPTSVYLEWTAATHRLDLEVKSTDFIPFNLSQASFDYF